MDTPKNTGVAATGVAATEAATRLATEAGIDLANVPGTGAEGQITKPDVEAAIRARTEEAGARTEAQTEAARFLAETDFRITRGVVLRAGGRAYARGQEAQLKNYLAKRPADDARATLRRLAERKQIEKPEN